MLISFETFLSSFSKGFLSSVTKSVFLFFAIVSSYFEFSNTYFDSPPDSLIYFFVASSSTLFLATFSAPLFFSLPTIFERIFSKFGGSSRSLSSIYCLLYSSTSTIRLSSTILSSSLISSLDSLFLLFRAFRSFERLF